VHLADSLHAQQIEACHTLTFVSVDSRLSKSQKTRTAG
jgi:hypothetical protein